MVRCTRVALLTEDPEEAARAEAHEVYLGDVTLGLRFLAEAVPPKGRPWPEPLPSPPPPPPRGPGGLNPLYAVARLAQTLQDRFLVDEAISLSPPLRRALPTEGARYLHGASGGLGFAPGAAVGAALAGEKAAAVVGDGAFLFAPQALHAAQTYGLDVLFVVLNNRGYGILKGFGESLYPGEASRLPGLSFPGVDFPLLAQAFGVGARRVETPEALEEALENLPQGPFLLEVALDPAPLRVF